MGAKTYPRKILATYRALILEAEHPHSRRTLKTYGMVTFSDRVIQYGLETHYASSVIVRLRIGHVSDSYAEGL